MSRNSYRAQRDRFIKELIDTLIESGFTKREAKAEIEALIKWARETS